METSEGDAEAFLGLSAALNALARKQGIRLHRRTRTVCSVFLYLLSLSSCNSSAASFTCVHLW